MKSHVRVRQKVYQVISFEGNEVVCGYILAAQYVWLSNTDKPTQESAENNQDR